MKKTLFTITLIFSLLLVSANLVSAAAFVKYDGIDGESKDENHDKWIDVLSIDWGAHRPEGGATGASRRRGGVVVEDLILVKEIDKATPKLMESALKGEVIPKVEIHLTASTADDGRVTYYAYELTNVMITSYQVSGATDGDHVPTETLSLNFEEVEWGFHEQGTEDKIWKFFGEVFSFLIRRSA